MFDVHPYCLTSCAARYSLQFFFHLLLSVSFTASKIYGDYWRRENKMATLEIFHSIVVICVVGFLM